ncbi:hypothetical protein BDQ12DRAFT_161755 [Crucibulum laeve]|uniref:Uncharacterized protein n=1 Tax=Crucibulum laeve TaxID=68775 RepID=A0A5C3LRG6_9AGAR|nr:hypothetical protein BDQ12DRAFT_161755 [Crucibulum laeve]
MAMHKSGASCCSIVLYLLVIPGVHDFLLYSDQYISLTRNYHSDTKASIIEDSPNAYAFTVPVVRLIHKSAYERWEVGSKNCFESVRLIRYDLRASRCVCRILDVTTLSPRHTLLRLNSQSRSSDSPNNVFSWSAGTV